MKAAQLEIEIDRPPAEVLAMLEDVTTHERYFDHFLADFKRVTRARSGVGAAVRVRDTRARRHHKMVVRVIKSSSRKVVLESKGGKEYRHRVRGTFEAKQRRDGTTRLRYTGEFLDGALADRMAWSRGRRRFTRVMLTALERLKEQVEA